jgi:hypothetical protein
MERRDRPVIMKTMRGAPGSLSSSAMEANSTLKSCVRGEFASALEENATTTPLSSLRAYLIRRPGCAADHKRGAVRSPLMARRRG